MSTAILDESEYGIETSDEENEHVYRSTDYEFLKREVALTKGITTKDFVIASNIGHASSVIVTVIVT